MTSLTYRLRRALAHRRLHRGRCANCRWVLRDDARGRFCSIECRSIWIDRACDGLVTDV
jgi:hypothetical protein